MNTKEAIEFLENDVLTISIIDRKVDEYYEKVKGIVVLLQQGEKYRTMWEIVKIWEKNDMIMVRRNIDEIEQKYFPKEAKQDNPSDTNRQTDNKKE